MNNLVRINNQDVQIKEFKGQRVITFKDIDTVHERPDGTARRNFNENKNHFIAGVDYFVRNSYEAKTEFNTTAPNGLVLITESGYLMLVKSFQDDLAWKVQRELVNNYFRVSYNKPSCIEDLIIMQAQEMKNIRTKLQENKQEIQNMRDVITLNPTQWRKDTTSLINKIALNAGGYDHIKIIREESYKLLNERFGVDVMTRLTNKRRRMADEGVCKSRRDKLTVLDVIADDKKLIEGYTAIIKEMAIKYKAA